MPAFITSLKIRDRLILGFAAICLVLAVAVGTTIWKVHGNDVLTQLMVQTRVPTAMAGGDLVAKLYGSLAALRGWMLTGNAAFNADNVICSTAFAFFPNDVPGTVISKNWQGQNLQVVSTDTEVTRGLLGGRGSLGSWSWDAYYQYGETTRDQIGLGYRRNWAYTFATDAVRDASGQIVCRVTRDGLSVYAVGVVDLIIAVGCQPLNIFGTTNASSQAMALLSFEHSSAASSHVSVVHTLSSAQSRAVPVQAPAWQESVSVQN